MAIEPRRSRCVAVRNSLASPQVAPWASGMLPAYLLRLLLILRLLRLVGVKIFRIRSARPGGTQEQLASIGEGYIARVGARLGMIAGLIAVHHDLSSLRERVLGRAAAKQ